MKIQWKKLLLCLAIPLAAGGGAAFLVRHDMGIYKTLVQPPLSPPMWVFPVVWSILYLLMGWASYLVLTGPGEASRRRKALTVYGLQLAANVLWPILFFGMKRYWLAFFWLLLLWALVGWTLALFQRLREGTLWLLAPYLAWVTFAGYLNLGVALLNR